MSLGDSGTGGAVSGMAAGGTGSGGGGGNLHHHHKKLRRKRKELDALVAEDKIRRKSSSASRHDLLQHSDSDDVEFSGRGSDMGFFFFGRGGLLGCLPGACALLVLLTTAVGVAAALRLLMATRKDLDALQMRLNAVEASGSELPAKFHESHVRLQQLEKNHTSLWTSLSSVSNDVRDITKKMTKLESSLKALEDRLSGTPQLSSLPKDVANIQDSVATFGSSLQDVQSALKALKEGYDQLHKKVDATTNALSVVKTDVLQLWNDTHLPPERERREKSSEREGKPVSAALLSLRSDVTELSSVVATVNASLTSSLNGRHSDDDKVQNLKAEFSESVKNLSAQVNLLERTCNKIENENLPNQIANLSSDLSNIKELSVQQHSQIQNLNQSIAVVKGVEKKLEGSQVQMASGVSELKQQLQKLEEELKSLMPPSSTPPSGQTNEGRMRVRETREVDEGLLEHPRKKRSP